MLRRRTTIVSTIAVLRLRQCAFGAAVSQPSGAMAVSALHGSARTLFENLSRRWGNLTSSDAVQDSDKAKGSSPENAGTAPPGPMAGLNAQQLQTMQQLFNSQPKEKQEQLLKQAMEMQKMMGKVPGFGKFAQRNANMLEQMMKMQRAASSSPPPPPQQSNGSAGTSTAGTSGGNSNTASASPSPSSARRDLFRDAASNNRSSASSRRTGPSLDDLKKVNLGPEIEALFAELRTIRQRKNEYREKFYHSQTQLESAQRELKELAAREANLRSKLSKAEQEVMLLTSENMEKHEDSKNVKQLLQTNRHLRQEVAELKAAAQASAAPGTTSYVTLQRQLQEREDTLRSLQRKVDRMRRRDPLLQFSLACSDVSRLCGSSKAGDAEESVSGSAVPGSSSVVSSASLTGAASATAVEAADEAFASLQASYLERQQAAWLAAAQEHGAAAAAYVAVVRRFVLSRVPHANLDAVVTFTGNVESLKTAFAEAGFTVEAVLGESDRVHVVAAVDAPACTTKPGPFGYALALRLAAQSGSSADVCHRASTATATTVTTSSPFFSVTHAHPLVSSTLVHNSNRSSVHYETARASGPGGQATNVTETQVYAKLSIDGLPAFNAEAQNSRSALSNKEAALDRLYQQRRQQFNETLARQERAETVQTALVEQLRSQGGLMMEEDVWKLVQDAAAAKQLSACDAALVGMLRELSQQASKTSS